MRIRRPLLSCLHTTIHFILHPILTLPSPVVLSLLLCTEAKSRTHSLSDLTWTVSLMTLRIHCTHLSLRQSRGGAFLPILILLAYCCEDRLRNDLDCVG